MLRIGCNGDTSPWPHFYIVRTEFGPQFGDARVGYGKQCSAPVPPPSPPILYGRRLCVGDLEREYGAPATAHATPVMLLLLPFHCMRRKLTLFAPQHSMCTTGRSGVWTVLFGWLLGCIWTTLQWGCGQYILCSTHCTAPTTLFVYHAVVQTKGGAANIVDAATGTVCDNVVKHEGRGSGASP